MKKLSSGSISSKDYGMEAPKPKKMVQKDSYSEEAGQPKRKPTMTAWHGASGKK